MPIPRNVLARLPLRSKLVLVVSVPLFVILGFAGWGVAGRVGDLEAQRQFGRLRNPDDALAALVASLENEGVLATWAVAAQGDPVVGAKLSRARDSTDRAASAVRAAGRQLGDDVGAVTTRAWDGLVATLGTLRNLRAQVTERAGLPATFASRFSDLVDGALDVAEMLARGVDDRDLSDGMLGIVDLRREQAAAAREAMVILPYLVTGSSNDSRAWVAAVTAQQASVTRFLSRARPAERSAFEAARSGAAPSDLVGVSANDVPAQLPQLSVTPAEYYENWRKKQAYLEAGVVAVQGVVDETAAEHEAGALRGVLAYGVGVAALVLAVLVLAWLMVRSVNRSLRVVTRAAQDIANVRLPQLLAAMRSGGEGMPNHLGEMAVIPVFTDDELGALARAFNTVQETTIRVAQEQAALLHKGISDLYVNLARRNQSLVDRQISLLDDMEARTEDPDQLAALFQLDHLATRMRRNAESLLVMSGSVAPRQWSESVPIFDVVRGAAAEIADFARITFVGFEGDVAVAGHAVADVTHALAELLENATAFSPPGSPVVVTGMTADRQFVISITDEGIGIDDTRLAAANHVLVRPPPPGLALSRTLGLHVVAHLAARHGIRVHLRRAATSGITAVVALPAPVLTRLGARAEPFRWEGTPVVASPPRAAVATPTGASATSSAAPPAPAPASVSAGPPHPGGPVSAGSVGWRSGDPAAPAGAGVTTARGAWWAVPEPDDLPRRATHTTAAPSARAAPDREDGARGVDAIGGLPHRTPGAHLTHTPVPPPAPGSHGDPRPRPERVHDLVTRHLRGIRDGRREPGPETPLTAAAPAAPEDDR